MPARKVFDNGSFQVFIDSDTSEVSFEFGLEYSFDIDSLLELVMFLNKASGFESLVSAWRKPADC